MSEAAQRQVDFFVSDEEAFACMRSLAERVLIHVQKNLSKEIDYVPPKEEERNAVIKHVMTTAKCIGDLIEICRRQEIRRLIKFKCKKYTRKNCVSVQDHFLKEYKDLFESKLIDKIDINKTDKHLYHDMLDFSRKNPELIAARLFLDSKAVSRNAKAQAHVV